MTGIDLLVSMMLMGCVDGHEMEYVEQGKRLSIQRYTCPLIGNNAEFYVWRRVCDDGHIAFAVEDQRDHRGFVYNRFGGIDTAFVNVELFDVYLPPCH